MKRAGDPAASRQCSDLRDQSAPYFYPPQLPASLKEQEKTERKREREKRKGRDREREREGEREGRRGRERERRRERERAKLTGTYIILILLLKPGVPSAPKTPTNLWPIFLINFHKFDMWGGSSFSLIVGDKAKPPLFLLLLLFFRDGLACFTDSSACNLVTSKGADKRVAQFRSPYPDPQPTPLFLVLYSSLLAYWKTSFSGPNLQHTQTHMYTHRHTRVLCKPSCGTANYPQTSRTCFFFFFFYKDTFDACREWNFFRFV